MRKHLLIGFISIILLTGCTKEEYFTCKIELNNEVQEYKLDAEYKVYYKNSYVTKVEKKEIYISDNRDTLDYFYEYKNLEYTNINNLYGGVTHNVIKDSNQVILKSVFDMNLVDIKKMIKNKYIDRDYINSNKLTTGGIKNIYKEKGAICDI